MVKSGWSRYLAKGYHKNQNGHGFPWEILCCESLQQKSEQTRLPVLLCHSVSLTACKNSRTVDQILIKLDIGEKNLFWNVIYGERLLKKKSII
jgi:hypothetical protein